MEFLLEEKLPQEVGKDVSQTPSMSQRKMIGALADTLTEEEYRELCHQLYSTKSEFDQVDGECTIKGGKERKYYYTVQSALYRGIFWQTLERLDFEKERRAAFRRAEEEWLDPSDFYEGR